MSPDILTSSGAYFNFLHPERSEISVPQIAAALSKICRFTGHTSEFYSVAQHSVYVSLIVPPEHAMWGLMHDAAEAFIGDVAKPLKMLLPDYQAIEKRVEWAVFKALGLSLPLPSSVKHADIRLLVTEQRDLMPGHTSTGKLWFDVEPLPQVIVPMGPKDAEALFLDRFEQIKLAEGK